MKTFSQVRNIIWIAVQFLVVLLLLAPPVFATAHSSPLALRHIVAIRFKATTTEKQIHEIEDAFRGLKEKIHQVKSLEGGTNISPENLNEGFTHGFLVTFQSEKDRDAYLIDPAHIKFKEFALPLVDAVFVIDFWGKP